MLCLHAREGCVTVGSRWVRGSLKIDGIRTEGELRSVLKADHSRLKPRVQETAGQSAARRFYTQSVAPLLSPDGANPVRRVSGPHDSSGELKDRLSRSQQGGLVVFALVAPQAVITSMGDFPSYRIGLSVPSPPDDGLRQTLVTPTLTNAFRSFSMIPSTPQQAVVEYNLHDTGLEGFHFPENYIVRNVSSISSMASFTPCYVIAPFATAS